MARGYWRRHRYQVVHSDGNSTYAATEKRAVEIAAKLGGVILDSYGQPVRFPCPVCGRPVEAVGHIRTRSGGEYVVTHVRYEHASRIENGSRVVNSHDCCYVPR